MILFFTSFVIPAQAGIQPSFQGLGSGNTFNKAHDVSSNGSGEVVGINNCVI